MACLFRKAALVWFWGIVVCSIRPGKAFVSPVRGTTISRQRDHCHPFIYTHTPSSLFVLSYKTILENVAPEKLPKVALELLEEKDQRLADKDKIIAAKDDLLAEMERRILSLQGLLTARGVMGYFAHSYLKRHVSLKGKKVPITNILSEAAKLAYNVQGTLPDDIQLLKEIYEECVHDRSRHNEEDCANFFRGLYGELSNEIHAGASWAGPGVKNTLLRVPRADEYICVVAQVCERKFNLDFE